MIVPFIVLDNSLDLDHDSPRHELLNAGPGHEVEEAAQEAQHEDDLHHGVAPRHLGHP